MCLLLRNDGKAGWSSAQLKGMAINIKLLQTTVCVFIEITVVREHLLVCVGASSDCCHVNPFPKV